MLTLDDWRISSPAKDKGDDLGLSSPYEEAFVGNELTIEGDDINLIDDRLQWIESYINKAAAQKVLVNYDNEEAALHYSSSQNERYSINDIGLKSASAGRVLFDATSLVFPELLYLMYWANLSGQNFDVVYLEPTSYQEKMYKPKIGSNALDYSLSEDGPGLCMLPRFALPLESSHLVVALGYEGHRFGGMLVSDEISPASITGILGVPPFELGMEKNSFAKNYLLMEEARKNYDAGFHTAPANDPLQNYRLLSTIMKSEAAIQRANRRIHVAPVGTKPVALAMAWFAINNKGTGVLYDFVRKRKKRSTGIGKVHFWRFSIV